MIYIPASWYKNIENEDKVIELFKNYQTCFKIKDDTGSLEEEIKKTWGNNNT